MKTLTYDQVISLAAADERDVFDANERIVAISPAMWRGKADLYEGWKAGSFQCNTVNLGGVPSYLVWWQKQDPACLHILGVCSIPGGVEDFPGFVEACEIICCDQGCSFALFHSTRKGMSRRMLALGAHIASVAYRIPNRKYRPAYDPRRHD